MLTGDSCIVKIGPKSSRPATFVASDGKRALVVFEDTGIEAKVSLDKVTDIPGGNWQRCLRSKSRKSAKSLERKIAK